MANLVETSRWEAGIYQFETSDPVMGGPNGIDNRPTRELANRTLWLKTELAKALESIGSNKTAADSALATKAAATTQMIAGNGLTGGGTLAANRTLTLGTPSSITASSTNSVTTTSHTHAIDQASTSTAGIVQLSTATNSTATNMAATPSAVKAAYDLAVSKASPAATLAGYGITDWVVGAKSIDSNADLNTVTTTGIYYQASSANASVTLNYPEARAGTLEVMYAYGYMQRYTTTTGRIYLRVYNSGWGAWIRMDGLDAASAATTITAGNGLTGGGTLAANRTLTLGTPSSITASSTNRVTTTSHTHAIDPASTSTAGIVQLSTATNSTATNMAATPSAVKAAYDLAKSTSTDAVMTSGDQNITGIKKFTGDLVSTYRLAINRGDQGYQPYITLTDSSINLETLSSRKAIGQIDFNVPSGASSELAAQIKAAVESNKTAAFEFLLRSESGNSVYKLNAKTPGTYNLVTSADQASTSTAGIVQLSTATNSTATNMAATPSAVKAAYDLAARKADLSDFASLRAGNGYQKLPNGLILQWGSVVVGVDSAVNITFPVAFPTAVLNVQSTVNGGGAIGGTVVLSSHVGSLSATGITVAMTEDGVPGAKPVYWFAIGC